MNKRHLPLTNLLVLTGCTHETLPSQTSDFWSLKMITESDDPVSGDLKSDADANVRSQLTRCEFSSSSPDATGCRDREIACVLGL